MKFNIGDRVKFLNDTGQGAITGFPDARTATVRNDDGFDVPVLITELIPAGGAGAGNWLDRGGKEETIQAVKTPETEPEAEATRTKHPVEEKVDKGLETLPDQSTEQVKLESYEDGHSFPRVFLAWVSGRKTNDYSLYLINDSPFYMLYLVQQKEGKAYRLMRAGKLEPDTKIRLGSFSRQLFRQMTEIRAAALAFHTSSNIPGLSSLHGIWTTEGMKAATELMFRENEFFDEQAWMVPLAPEKPASATRPIPLEEWQERQKIEELYRSKETPETITAKNPPVEMEEIDLHIESIVKQTENLDPTEILEIQKSRFVTALEGGIRSGVKKMVFIHGVGDGKLKYEIRRIIDRQYPRLRYQDASFMEYGYGATMVIFP